MVDGLDLEDYTCGGYLIVKPSPAGVPEHPISISRCLAEVMPDVWCLSWAGCGDDERYEHASNFGLSLDDTTRAIDWVTDRFDKGDIGWPGVFLSAQCAQEFLATFLPGQQLNLIGLGLPKDLVKDFLTEADPGVLGKSATYLALERNQKLEKPYGVMGYEVLGYDTSDFHSWVCNGLHKDEELSAVTLNQHGLIDNLADARKVAEYVRRDEVGAEPAIWRPWVLLQYLP